MALPTISKKTLYELEIYLTGWTLREIEVLFDSSDVQLCEDFDPNVSGQRRTLILKYLKSLDATRWEDTRKLMRVFELVFVRLEDEIRNGSWKNVDHEKGVLESLTKWLRRDGFISKDGRITTAGQVTSFPHLVAIADTADLHYLLQQLDRIEGAIETDPWLAIGTAKEMVETTCRTILVDRGKTTNKDWDLMTLCKEARKELRLTPDDIHDQSRASDTIRRLLSNLATIVQGLAELRNPYGTGHGPEGRAKGLHARHARLAAGAASTLALFLLETHREKQSTATEAGQSA